MPPKALRLMLYIISPVLSNCISNLYKKYNLMYISHQKIKSLFGLQHILASFTNPSNISVDLPSNACPLSFHKLQIHQHLVNHILHNLYNSNYTTLCSKYFFKSTMLQNPKLQLIQKFPRHFMYTSNILNRADTCLNSRFSNVLSKSQPLKMSCNTQTIIICLL